MFFVGSSFCRCFKLRQASVLHAVDARPQLFCLLIISTRSEHFHVTIHFPVNSMTSEPTLPLSISSISCRITIIIYPYVWLWKITMFDTSLFVSSLLVRDLQARGVGSEIPGAAQRVGGPNRERRGRSGVVAVLSNDQSQTNSNRVIVFSTMVI